MAVIQIVVTVPLVDVDGVGVVTDEVGFVTIDVGEFIVPPVPD